jgi:hypothetical protein
LSLLVVFSGRPGYFWGLTSTGHGPGVAARRPVAVPPQGILGGKLGNARRCSAGGQTQVIPTRNPPAAQPPDAARTSETCSRSRAQLPDLEKKRVHFCGNQRVSRSESQNHSVLGSKSEFPENEAPVAARRHFGFDARARAGVPKLPTGTAQGPKTQQDAAVRPLGHGRCPPGPAGVRGPEKTSGRAAQNLQPDPTPALTIMSSSFCIVCCRLRQAPHFFEKLEIRVPKK